MKNKQKLENVKEKCISYYKKYLETRDDGFREFFSQEDINQMVDDYEFSFESFYSKYNLEDDSPERIAVLVNAWENFDPTEKVYEESQF